MNTEKKSMLRLVDYVAIFTIVSLFAVVIIAVIAVTQPESKYLPLAIDQPTPQSVASTPSPSNDPAPSLVDFEDMAGLDVATQELLNERYRDVGPADYEKRIRRLEWAVSALSDRVFGKSLLPGEGQIGELGSDGASEATND